MRTEVLAVSGRLDRLDLRDGPSGDVLVVVDYKTGRRDLNVFDARSSLALALYALAAGRTFRRDCVRVELHHVPSGEVIAHDHTAESLQRHLARAEAIGAEAGAAEPAFRGGLSSAVRRAVPDAGVDVLPLLRLRAPLPRGLRRALSRRPVGLRHRRRVLTGPAQPDSTWAQKWLSTWAVTSGCSAAGECPAREITMCGSAEALGHRLPAPVAASASSVSP